MNEYTFDEIKTGFTESFLVKITEEKMAAFEGITGDTNPLHKDSNYAKEKGYRDRVVYGMLTTSLISTLAGVYLPGKYSLISQESMMFKNPVIVGDTLKVKGTVIERNEKFKFITLKVEITNQNNEIVVFGKMDVGVTM